MLGAGALRQIPESEGYTRVHLGLETLDGAEFTLERATEGGNFRLHEGRHLQVAPDKSGRTLSSKHSPTSDNNVSNWLLGLIGMSGTTVRRNRDNITRSVSMRDLAHICVIDETRMQAVESPVFPSRQWVQQTAERSLFRTLLTGTDDSALVPNADKKKRSASKAKLEVVDRLIAEVSDELSSRPSMTECAEAVTRLDAAIVSSTAAVEQLLSQREDLLGQQNGLSERISVNRMRATELSELIARFGILAAQYRSDLDRLDMVREAGTLLGYFRSGVCVFCGAAPEYQTLQEHVSAEQTALAEAVEAEVAKTRALEADLNSTIADLRGESNALEHEYQDTVRRLGSIRGELSRHESALSPQRAQLTELISSRSSATETIERHRQLQRLEDLRRELAREAEQEGDPAPQYINARALREFAGLIRKTLDVWQVPDSNTVTYSESRDDIIVGDQPRSTRGKGMRAILHAAYTTSLAMYCLERDLPHPGFIVLDSPVVTYRGPELGDAVSITDELMPRSVADNVFTYLAEEFLGQSIVIENVDPPANLVESAVKIQFTKADKGRAGFFPPR